MLNAEEKISKRISRYRTLAGYTQQTAAEAIGMNKNSYARMERTGNPKPDVLKKLSALFNVPVSTLLYGEGLETGGEEEATPLKDTGVTIKKDDPLLLTTNEKNIIKIFRSLPQKQKNDLLKQILDLKDDEQ